MTKNQFANFVRNCDSKYFKEMTLEKRGKLIPLKKMLESKDSKRIYFQAFDEQDSFNIFKNSIADVDMLTTSREDYQYSIMITTKSDNEFSFKVHFNMAEGYSPYAYTENIIKNYKEVADSIPKYMDKFIGKTVTVLHCTNTAIYRTFSEEYDGHTFPVTDSYIISDFAYEIRYDKVAPNIPCIKMYSKSNNKIFTYAMCVSLITDHMIFTADGEFKLNVIE